MLAKAAFRFSMMLLFLVACSPVAVKTNPDSSITVKVTANEFGYRSSQTAFKVGQKYHIEVTNQGKVPHEIMLIKPIQPGAMNMEALDEMALAQIPEEELQPGQTKTMDVTFTRADTAEKLEFACHIPGHYEAGMKLPITLQ